MAVVPNLITAGEPLTKVSAPPASRSLVYGQVTLSIILVSCYLFGSDMLGSVTGFVVAVS